MVVSEPLGIVPATDMTGAGVKMALFKTRDGHLATVWASVPEPVQCEMIVNFCPAATVTDETSVVRLMEVGGFPWQLTHELF